VLQLHSQPVELVPPALVYWALLGLFVHGLQTPYP
jgi:hypothetical protein